MGKSSIPNTMVIALAKLGHVNDASGDYFSGLLHVPIRMKRSAGGSQVMPSLLEGVAEDANDRRIKRRCIERTWKRQNYHCALKTICRAQTNAASSLDNKVPIRPSDSTDDER
jgi:hypothetical protein